MILSERPKKRSMLVTLSAKPHKLRAGAFFAERDFGLDLQKM
jgi:hypothetical protein